MKVKEQIDRLRQLENVYKSRFKGEPLAGSAFGDAADTLEKLYAVYEAAKEYSDWFQTINGPDQNLQRLDEAIAAVESE